MSKQSLALLAVGIVLNCFSVAALSYEVTHGQERDPNQYIDRAIDADVRCHARCAAAGWGSLNAFYSPRFARCMCQDINPHGHIDNDYEGYRILRASDLP